MLKNCRRGNLFLHCLSDGLAKLVWARSVLEAAADAFQTLEHFINFHAIHQCADALRVAVAAAVKLHILDNAVLDFKLDGLATSALGSVGVFHWLRVFCRRFDKLNDLWPLSLSKSLFN